MRCVISAPEMSYNQTRGALLTQPDCLSKHPQAIFFFETLSLYALYTLSWLNGSQCLPPKEAVQVRFLPRALIKTKSVKRKM